MKDNMKILVGIDGSDHSKHALEEAVITAKRFSGLVKVVTVYRRGKDQESERVLKEAENLMKKEKINYETISILG